MAVLIKIDPRDFQTSDTSENIADVRVRGRSNAKPSLQPSVADPGERAFLWGLKKYGGAGLRQRGRLSSRFHPDGNDYLVQVRIDAEAPVRLFTQNDVNRTRERRIPGVDLNLAEKIGSLAHPCVRELTDQEAEFLENFYETSSAVDRASDIIGIWRDTSLTETEREALIRARLGQGQFRAELLVRWTRQCAVTGSSVEEVLRASHIKPWHISNNQERRNPENGLLLIANLDALFDRFLMSFDDDGRMLISDRIEEGSHQQLGLLGPLRRPPTSAERGFLRYHREEGGRRRISYRLPFG